MTDREPEWETPVWTRGTSKVTGTRERRNPTPTNNPFSVLQPDSEVRPRVLQEEGPQEEEIIFEQDTLHHTTETSESESETKTENSEYEAEESDDDASTDSSIMIITSTEKEAEPYQPTH